MVLDPQATLLFQTTDFTLHSSARMSSQRLELKRRPKPKSWRKLANGISMVFHPFIPDIQVRGQHESLPQKVIPTKIQLSQFWWYLFGGYTSSIHGLKGLCLVTKATKCTILGSFPGTCLCIAATHHGGRSRSYGMIDDFHHSMFFKSYIGLVKVNQAIFLWRFQGWRCSFSDFVSYLFAILVFNITFSLQAVDSIVFAVVVV